MAVDLNIDAGPRLFVEEHPMVCAGQSTGPAERIGYTRLHRDRGLGSTISLDPAQRIMVNHASHHDVAFLARVRPHETARVPCFGATTRSEQSSCNAIRGRRQTSSGGRGFLARLMFARSAVRQERTNRQSACNGA